MGLLSRSQFASGRADDARHTLELLRTRFEKQGQKRFLPNIDGIHLDMLYAIALYRQDDKVWQEHLLAALDAAKEFSFIRTISMYGNAALPLLEALPWSNDNKWGRRLIGAVRMQASYYPAFLQPPLPHGEELTAAEMQVLRLICADRSNAEIGAILNIKLPTVKTHVRHILTKMNVSRRSEAKTAAKKLRLIPDDL